jgi:endonuclease YncB( thermonuclease family)
MNSLQIWSTVLFLVSAAATSGAAQAQQYNGTVTKITDGDTIHFLADGTGSSLADWTIRLVGIDTPETHLSVPGGVVSQNPWGTDAGNFLAKLIPVGSKITLQAFGTDVHGRVLGRLLSKNRDANLRMVETGYAIPYMICEGKTCDPQFYERFQVVRYFQACDQARASRVGIFNPANPLKEMPFEFRLRMQKRKADKYVGDISTKKLYAPDQYRKVDLCRRIFFIDPNAAKKLGYKPAI